MYTEASKVLNEFLGYEGFSKDCDIKKFGSMIDLYFCLKFDGKEAPKFSEKFVEKMVEVKEL